MEDLQISDRMEMLRAFDQTQAGVKGLLDSGIQKLPRIFVRPSEELSQGLTRDKSEIRVPVVNHGIPQSVLDGVIEGVRKFNEQDVEMKKMYYSRDRTKTARFNSSYDLFMSKTASWRDTLSISIPDSVVGFDPNGLPPPCRESALEFSKHVQILGNVLLGLLSEALGLETDRLENAECSKGHRLHCHYYPACPEPNLAIGLSKHSDAGFLAILLQNQVTSGLQILHHGQWIDIWPVPGALVVNIGDLLHLVSNGKFQSVEHRAISNPVGPRISVACFFSGPEHNPDKVYGVFEELVSEKNPAAYKEVVLGEYFKKFLTTGLDGCRVLDYYKV